MKFLFENRPIEDKIVLGKICFDILSQDINDKEFSDDFCGVWVDGRNREINCIEDIASIKSFYLYSEKKYPLYLFCNNDRNILQGLDISKLPIHIRHIDEINTHDKYIEFCKFKLPFLIPDKHEKLLYLQADSFLIKNGWEKYLGSINVDYLGSPWLHAPGIQADISIGWVNFNLPNIRVGNGAISYRSLSVMRNISTNYGGYKLKEMGTENKSPSEDLFFAFFTHVYGRLATVEQASKFCADPLTLEIYNNKSVFGGHFPVYRDLFREKYFKNG